MGLSPSQREAAKKKSTATVGREKQTRRKAFETQPCSQNSQFQYMKMKTSKLLVLLFVFLSVSSSLKLHREEDERWLEHRPFRPRTPLHRTREAVEVQDEDEDEETEDRAPNHNRHFPRFRQMLSREDDEENEEYRAEGDQDEDLDELPYNVCVVFLLLRSSFSHSNLAVFRLLIIVPSFPLHFPSESLFL